MIDSREELRGAQRQIEGLLEILDEMRREEPSQSHALLCKSYVQRVRKIQQEIEEYLGIKEIVTDEVVA